MRQADQKCYLGKKIQDDSGATLFIALLFFIICATCGAVLLVAGTQAAGRIAGLTKNEQNLYAATSAAKMLKDEINNRTVTITTKENTGISKANIEVSENKNLINDGRDIEDFLKDALVNVYNSKNKYEHQYNMTVSGHDDLDVKVNLTVFANDDNNGNTKYKMIAECIAGTGDNQVIAYANLPAGSQEIKSQNDDENQEKEIITTITYNGGFVSSEAQ